MFVTTRTAVLRYLQHIAAQLSTVLIFNLTPTMTFTDYVHVKIRAHAKYTGTNTGLPTHFTLLQVCANPTTLDLHTRELLLDTFAVRPCHQTAAPCAATHSS